MANTPGRPLRPLAPPPKPVSPDRIDAALSTLLDLYGAYEFGPDDQHAISRVRDILHAVEDGTIEDEL